VSLVIHHAITDWRGLGVVMAEFFRQLAAGPGAEKREGLPFSAYLSWLNARDFSSLRPFWEERLRGLDGPTPLPLMPMGRLVDSGEVIECDAEIPAELSESLRQMAVRSGVTMATVLLAAWALFLSRATGERRVMFGVVRAGYRGRRDCWREVDGPLMNTLPLVLEVPDDEVTGVWLRRVRAEWLALYESEHCPLDRVREWSGFPGTVPLFGTVVNVQRTTMEEYADEVGRVSPFRLTGYRQRTDVPMAMLGNLSGNLRVCIRAYAGAVSPEMAAGAAVALRSILEGFVVCERGSLGKVGMVRRGDSGWHLAMASGPRVEVACGGGVDAMLQRARRRWPDRLALESGGEVLTHEVLHARADSLAGMLRERGVRPGERVVLVLPAGPLLAAAVLAVIRSGGVFCLLDAGQPMAALERGLEAVRPAWVIGEERVAGSGRFLAAEVLREALTGVAGTVAGHEAAPSDLCYLVQTSGSTGEPKVVQIEHGSVVNLMVALREVYGLRPEDRRLQWARPGTDFFIAELLVNLGAGVCLVTPDAAVRSDLEKFVAVLRDEAITVVSTPGSHWHEWMRAARRDPRLRPPEGLRLCITGMEAISIAGLETWMEVRGAGTSWVNAYGPSETTMVCAAYELGAGERHELPVVPVGSALCNVSVLVLDRAGQLMPLGMVGEICVAGVGVMRGYSGGGGGGGGVEENRHDADGRMPRMYRTGDYGYRLPGGAVVFYGRRDQQVKIRGHRVETGLVEAVLRQRLPCSNAVVLVVQQAGRDVLAAVLETSEAVDADVVREAVAGCLPAYMVPSRVECVGRMPVLSSGKTDRKALMGVFGDETCGGVEEGRGECDRLVGIWRRFLGTGAGMDSDFFERGGDSLAAMEAVVEIGRVMGVKVSAADLHAAPTPRAMGEFLRDGAAVRRRHVAPVRRCDAAERTLFVIPGWQGNPGMVSRIAEHLPEGSAVWALHGSDLSDEELGAGGLERLADRYAEEMVSVHGEGEFHLIGHSVGGIIAFAVARALQGRGRVIGRVTVLDGFPCGVPRGVLEASSVAGRLLVRAIRAGRSRAGMIRRSWRDPRGWFRAGSDVVVVAGGEEGVDRFAKLAMSYGPEPAEVPVLLVLAGRERYGAVKRRGWEWLSCGRFAEVRIDCDHHELVREGNLSQVGPLVFGEVMPRKLEWRERLGSLLRGE
jgi:amino acid adenylation domain-containing protein